MHPQQVRRDTKLVEVVGMQEGRAAIQRDLRRLEWANKKPVMLNKKQGRKQLGREGMGILMGNKLNRTRQHDPVATKENGRQEHSQKIEGVFLFCFALLRLWTPRQEGAQLSAEVVGSEAHAIPGKAARAGCVLAEKAQ